MSFISGTVANLAATATTNVVSKVWDHSAGHANYLINFADNHKSLTDTMDVLRSKMDHVKRRIHVDEATGIMRTPVVDAWLRRVEAVEHEVNQVLQEGAQQLQQRCLGGCCFQNWCKSYRLGKKISKKLPLVVDLISEGDFNTVADRSLPVPVQLKQESQTVGMDALFDKVWRLFGEDEVKMLGIYGMGGVGKTTLLRKINNSLDEMGGKFDVVIWVVVSKGFNITKVQKQMGDRLGLAWPEDAEEDAKAQHIFNVLRMKKFVVLLNDLWQQTALDAIGIPSPRNCNSNSKVVFTTRSESVCASMEVDQKVRVDVLDRDQAWTLFQQKVGPEALSSHPEIPEMAKGIVKECRGLPLAIITVGRAMATKKSPQEWKHALKTLKKSASQFSGMEDKVFSVLKFSYDNLENDIARSLFSFFSLYPEDYNIQKGIIAEQWVLEEFVDDSKDLDDAVDLAYDIIGSLQAACLIEGGFLLGTGYFAKEFFVHMHDLIRDLALWIGSECGKKKNKYLVEAGVGLTQVTNPESWSEAQRISLMDNNISVLPKPPSCPNLLTLWFRNNPLSNITPDFFEYMPNLRVLDLSNSQILNLPKSICGLAELQSLSLHNTRIEVLPDELGNLMKLRSLGLNDTPYLNNIPGDIISKISRLQVLGMYNTGTRRGGNIYFPGVEELESLQRLRSLYITIQDNEILKSVCRSPILSSCIRGTCMFNCQDLTRLELASPLPFGNTKKMETITLEGCLELKEVIFNCSTENNKKNMGLLPSLDSLYFQHLPKMNVIWTGERSTHLHFRNVYWIDFGACHALKDLSWLVLVPDLLHLRIVDCESVEEILVNGFAATSTENQTLFSKLELLYLEGLPKLESISRVALAFPCSKRLRVIGCPLLKKLPFTSNNSKASLIQIYGETN